MGRLQLVALVAGAVAVAAGHLGAGAALVGGAFLGYAIGCWVWPYRRCWRCGGSGKRYDDRGSAYGVCRWCRGLRRERWGRRLWTYWRVGS